MKYILLPGHSERNKDWGDELKRNLKKRGFDITTVDWNHWKTGKSFSIPKESIKVQKLIGKDKVIVMAKSVGTRLAAEMIFRGELNPEKVILMGVPSEDEIYEKAFGNFDPKKIVVIQNQGDPYKSSNEIKEFFEKINPGIKLIETDRTDHSYPFPEIISENLH